MELTDTHSHLYATEFTEDMDAVIERCIQNKVKRIFLPNIDEDTIKPLNDLYNLKPSIFFPIMGLHPCSVKKEELEMQLSLIKEELYNGNYYAVGETGIDLHWDKSSFPEQKIAFERQIEWALDLNLPIVIHARESTSEILEILEKYSHNLKGVFHCFSGNEKQANEVIGRGMSLGLGGVLTFKNSNLKDIIKDIDMRHLVLETDSPYLAPVPYRGKRNESSYILNIAEYLADLKGISLEEVAKQTTENSKILFKI